MSRRCRPGQRARIISGWNGGKIVVVVRPYFGETVSDATWPEAIFPWVITSLSVPLRARCIATGLEVAPSMTIVVDDRDLQPLDDDEESSADSAELRRPDRQRFGQRGQAQDLASR